MAGCTSLTMRLSVTWQSTNTRASVNTYPHRASTVALLGTVLSHCSAAQTDSALWPRTSLNRCCQD